jgi:BirA family transcriptional regulator, biotin operon repressor / biotin---[acetyl-CoA-carboxylase] ligase
MQAWPQWDVAALQQAARTTVLPNPSLANFSDLTAEVVLSVDSTNSEIMRRAKSGQLGPQLLVAHTQTAGRGRGGRTWVSQPGQALTFSLGLPLQLQASNGWSGLSLAVGVSVAEGLHSAIRLKWPNDLVWQDRKLGGILIETVSIGEARYAVIGVGINLAAPDATGLTVTPAWLAELLPQSDPQTVLVRVLQSLLPAMQVFSACGFAAFTHRYAALDMLRDRSVRLSGGGLGIAAGVSTTGTLLVRTDSGLQEVSSAEVSVRLNPA